MKRLKKIILASIFAYVYILMLLIAPTQYSAILEGDLQNTRDIVSIGDYPIYDMHTIYVMSYAPLSFFQYQLLQLQGGASIYETTRYEESLTVLEQFQIGQIQKTSSYQTALIVAFEKANKSIDYSFLGYALTSIPNKESHLKINDHILSINQETLTPFTNLTQVLTAEKMDISLVRDGQIVDITYNKKPHDIPLLLYPMYWITQTEVPYDLTGLANVIGGPSSGLIMTLSIYATLMGYEPLYTIGGTGTMSLDGKVGAIGGLYQKYVTAYETLDYMLIPHAQRLQLQDLDNQKIITVSTIDQAIEFLESLYE